MHLVMFFMSITNIHGLRLYNTSNRINTCDSVNATIVTQNLDSFQKTGAANSADKFKKARDLFEGRTTQDTTNKKEKIDQEITQSYNPLDSRNDFDINPVPKDENILKMDATRFSNINHTCSSYLKSLSNFSLPTAYYLKYVEFYQARYLAAKQKSNELLNQIISEIKIFILIMMTNEVVPMPEIALSEDLEDNTLEKGQFYFTKNRKLHVLNNLLDVLKKALEIASIYNNFCLIEEINVFLELNEGLINNLQNHDIDYLTTIKDPSIMTSLHLSNIKIN